MTYTSMIEDSFLSVLRKNSQHANIHLTVLSDDLARLIARLDFAEAQNAELRRMLDAQTKIMVSVRELVSCPRF